MATDVRRSPAKTVFWYVVLTGLSIVVLFPVWMAVVRALSNPTAYLLEGLPIHPVQIEGDVFQRAWDRGDLGPKLANSVIVTLAIVIGQVLTSILAAYAFAYLRFPLKKLVFAVFMATLMLPIEVTLLPNLDTIREIGLFNSYAGLALPFLATAFGTFLIRQGFLGIPRDLRDAAQLDGYGHLQFLWRVAIPVTRPVIASFTVIAFFGAWNQYTWPRSAVDEGRWETLQVGLKSLTTAAPEEQNVAVAAAIIAAVPILILLIFLQRHLIRGLTAGAVKG